MNSCPVAHFFFMLIIRRVTNIKIKISLLISEKIFSVSLTVHSFYRTCIGWSYGCTSDSLADIQLTAYYKSANGMSCTGQISFYKEIILGKNRIQ